jgi:hypothetical protein
MRGDTRRFAMTCNLAPARQNPSTGVWEPSMKTIFDASFKYKHSLETDVRKTFERIRREQQAARRKQEPAANTDMTAKVVQLDQMKGI